MTVTHVFAGLAVREYEAACAWYELLLGRPPDTRPHPSEAVWQLSGGALVYVVADEARAGGGLLTIAVDRLDDKLAELVRHGIPAWTETLSNGVRKAIVEDPDGNTISFFEAPSAE
jgi:catechol 2,3-dioxygenase-like lactoylglutathione lyase family enzyme